MSETYIFAVLPVRTEKAAGENVWRSAAPKFSPQNCNTFPKTFAFFRAEW